MTGLPNRTAYYQSTKNIKDMQFMLIDLIDFSTVNNIFGMDAGDHTLKKVAEILNVYAQSHQQMELYRIGADEFALVMHGRDEEFLDRVAKDVIYIVENTPIHYKDIDIPVVVNVGVSTVSPHLLNAQLCVKALHSTFGKKVKFFTEEMNNPREVKENVKMVQRVKEAIENDGITPYFQGITDTQTHATVRYEALVRLEEEDRCLSPFFFLDIAKKVKLYNALSHIMLVKSIDTMRKLDIEVAVNISIEDILEAQNAHFIYNLVRQNSDLAPKLTFEIVESEQIENYNILQNFIDTVKAFGCKIAIDDFGSGYSNFDHLINLKVDYLKIDGSLIKHIHEDNNSKMIVKTIVAFAKEAGIETVAEFVHNAQVARIIEELGIDYAQGFFYAEPTKLL